MILNESLDLAEQHYSLALAAGHNSYWTHFNRAQLFRRTARLGEAATDLLRAIEFAASEGRSNATGDAACDLANDLLEQGDTKNARTLLDAASTICPSVRIQHLTERLEREVEGEAVPASKYAISGRLS